MSLRCHLAESLNLSWMLWAHVLFEALLRHAIEGERGDGAVQARSSHAPRATRASPAVEVFVFGPEFLAISAGAWNRAG